MAQWTISSLKLDEKSIKDGLEVQKSFLPRQNKRSFSIKLSTESVKFKFTDPQRKRAYVRPAVGILEKCWPRKLKFHTAEFFRFVDIT